MTFLLTNAIHANLYQQYNRHVAYNISRHEISVDTSKINRNSLVNCAKCKKDKTVQFIADSGAKLIQVVMKERVERHVRYFID